MIFLPILIFAIGTVIGSFLNVVILRLNTGRSISKGRSKCSRCSTQLSWYELIPVFSFLGLRGKCKSCNNPISFQYPVVELVTAFVFTLLYSKIFLFQGFNFLSVTNFIFSCTVAALLIVIFIYDIRHKIIPNKIVYPLIILSLASILFKLLFLGNTNAVSLLISGFVLAAPFFLIWYFSKGEGMGFGDVKLALALGFILGLEKSLTMFFLSFWLGAIVGLLLISLSKAKMKTQIPFAPFMIISFFIVTIWEVTLKSIFTLW